MSPAKRQRKKTFTGCWTCRSRRVKCDEQTPFCQRCRAFGVPCEGYGVRLTWLIGDGEGQPHLDSDEDVNNTHASRPRRSMRTSENPQTWWSPRWSAVDVDAMLERIDECAPESSKTEHGIFSVFPAQTMGLPHDYLTPRSSTLEGVAPESMPAAQEPSCSRAPSRADVSFDHVAFDTPTDLETPYPALTPRPFPVISNLAPLPDDQERPTRDLAASEPTESVSLQALGNRSIRTDDHTVDAMAYQPRQPAQHPLRHLDLLRMPASQKRLIHHWVTFTSVKLVLVDEPHNPCRTMMLPMALKGLMSDLDESTANIAIFHAICACAAYNLFELGGRKSEEDRALAWKHDEQAIHHLRHNLAQADQHCDQSFAMAIMSCITIEAISGNTGRWRTHLNGGLAYLTKLRERAVDTEISFAFQVHLVSMAILCGYQVPEELKTFLRGPEKLEISFPYYGASRTFLENLDRIQTLAASTTAANQVELDAFELQLYLGFPVGNPSGLADSQPGVHGIIMHHMAQAFYYACLVHYQRSVCRVTIDSVQILVEQGVSQLEGIEKLSRRSAGSVMMWAPLVLAAEANTPSLQHRVTNWFRGKRKLGFRNLIILDDMIRSLWAKRIRGDMETTWQDLIVRDGFDVFRL